MSLITTLGGHLGSVGREGCLLIARLAVQSPTPPRSCAEVSLSKTLNPTLAPDGQAGALHGSSLPSVCVSVSMNG